MDLLSRREHSIAELTQKLMEKGFDEICIDEVLAVLVEEGLLSDARYVESYVRSRMNRGFGPVRIQQELRQRGIPGALISEHLNFQDESWPVVVKQVWQKKFGGAHPEDIHARARQQHFLQYRGFTTEQTKHIFKDLD